MKSNFPSELANEIIQSRQELPHPVHFPIFVYQSEQWCSIKGKLGPFGSGSPLIGWVDFLGEIKSTIMVIGGGAVLTDQSQSLDRINIRIIAGLIDRGEDTDKSVVISLPTFSSCVCFFIATLSRFLADISLIEFGFCFCFFVWHMLPFMFANTDFVQQYLEL